MKGRAVMAFCVLMIAAIGAYAPEVIVMAFAAMGFCLFCGLAWAAWQVRKAFRQGVK